MFSSYDPDTAVAIISFNCSSAQKRYYLGMKEDGQKIESTQMKFAEDTK